MADSLPALRESVSIARHESRQNILVGASLRSWQAYADLCVMAAGAVAAALLGEGVAQGKRLLGEGTVWAR